MPLACSAGSETIAPSMSKSATSSSPDDLDGRQRHPGRDVLGDADGPVPQHDVREPAELLAEPVRGDLGAGELQGRRA